MDDRVYFITGASGKLGTYMRNMKQNVSPTRDYLDILEPESIEKILNRYKIDAILHLAAITCVKDAEDNKELAYKTNVIGTRNVAQLAEKHKLKMFYTSTDYVFSCTKGNYSEQDNPSPTNWYGNTKFAGELEIKNATDNFCIIRTSFRPIKWNFPTAFTNVYTSADYVDIIAKEVSLALEFDVSGIINIGTEKKTFYDLAKQRNPTIMPEECKDENFPKRRDFNLEKWMQIKNERGQK